MSKELLAHMQTVAAQRKEAEIKLAAVTALEDARTNLEHAQYYAREVVRICEEQNIKVELTDILSPKVIKEVSFDESEMDSSRWW